MKNSTQEVEPTPFRSIQKQENDVVFSNNTDYANANDKLTNCYVKLVVKDEPELSIFDVHAANPYYIYPTHDRLNDRTPMVRLATKPKKKYPVLVCRIEQ